MKKYLAILVLALLLLGCTGGDQPPQQQPPAQPPSANQTPTPPTNQTPPPANQTPSQTTSVGIDQIYRYGSVNNYTYKISSNSAGGPTNETLKTTITSDMVNGVASWLQSTDMQVGNLTITLKVWVDNVTYKCLKQASSGIFAGQYREQEFPCSQEGPNSALRTGTTTPRLDYIGKGSITVPAGTFIADKYSLENVTYWATSSIPIPIKVTWGNGWETMELVSYNSINNASIPANNTPQQNKSSLEGAVNISDLLKNPVYNQQVKVYGAVVYIPQYGGFTLGPEGRNPATIDSRELIVIDRTSNITTPVQLGENVVVTGKLTRIDLGPGIFQYTMVASKVEKA